MAKARRGVHSDVACRTRTQGTREEKLLEPGGKDKGAKGASKPHQQVNVRKRWQVCSYHLDSAATAEQATGPRA